jgi:hypothetical protein
MATVLRVTLIAQSGGSGRGQGNIDRAIKVATRRRSKALEGFVHPAGWSSVSSQSQIPATFVAALLMRSNFAATAGSASSRSAA